MDFSFSDEQEMLRSSARSFLAERSGPDRVAEVADSDESWDPATWREIAELGWVGLSAPESAGGAGYSFLEEAVLFEELGRALYPGPYLSTVALALPALTRTPERLGRVASGGTATLAWAEPGALRLGDPPGTEARRDGDRWFLTGSKTLVPDAAIADQVLVVAGGEDGAGIWVCEPAPGARRTMSTVDPTRRFGRLELDREPAELLAGPDESRALLDAIRRRALSAAALEAVGVAQFALDAARSYVGERRQFGKPIGSYQAVAHQVADAYVQTELARSLAYWAAWCVAEDDAMAEAAAHGAKAFAADVAVWVCERSIQVHGGVGFTWEHPLHRYLKRALWLQSFDGPPRMQRARVADLTF